MVRCRVYRRTLSVEDLLFAFHSIRIPTSPLLCNPRRLVAGFSFWFSAGHHAWFDSDEWGVSWYGLGSNLDSHGKNILETRRRYVFVRRSRLLVIFEFPPMRLTWVRFPVSLFFFFFSFFFFVVKSKCSQVVLYSLESFLKKFFPKALNVTIFIENLD